MDGRKSGDKDIGILREETGHEESRKLSTIVRPNIVLVILYIKISYCVDDNASLPPANEVLGKVMFLHLSVCSYDSLPTGGVYIQGVCLQGGLHPGWVGRPPPPPELEKRAVRILLEVLNSMRREMKTVNVNTI